MSRPKHKHVSNEIPNGVVEKAYIVKKLSLQEWQVVELQVQGDRVLSRTSKEPNLAAIVASKLMTEIRGQ